MDPRGERSGARAQLDDRRGFRVGQQARKLLGEVATGRCRGPDAVGTTDRPAEEGPVGRTIVGAFRACTKGHARTMPHPWSFRRENANDTTVWRGYWGT